MESWAVCPTYDVYKRQAIGYSASFMTISFKETFAEIVNDVLSDDDPDAVNTVSYTHLATISKWCTNTSQPDLVTLTKVAALLDVDAVSYTHLVQLGGVAYYDDKQYFLFSPDSVNQGVVEAFRRHGGSSRGAMAADLFLRDGRWQIMALRFMSAINRAVHAS